MSRSLVVLLLVAVPASLAAGGDPPAEETGVNEVLERFVVAVGGREALEELDVRHFQGTIVQDLSWTDPQHEEWPFMAESDVEGVVRYGEVDDWSELPEAHAAGLRSKLLWIMHPRFALVIEDFFPHLTVKGTEVREGRPVVVLAPRDLKFEHYALYFDEETGLLAHVGYHNDLHDWSKEDGVLFPHRWVFGRKGGHTTYVFEDVGRGPGSRD